MSLGVTAQADATVFTNNLLASFGSIGAGGCRGGAVGISGHAPGQVVMAHTTETNWDAQLQVTAIPGPAPDQVGYKICNVGSSPADAPAPGGTAQAIRLASISPGSGQSTAAVVKNFPEIAADACSSATESVPGAQASGTATAQPEGKIEAPYAASGGLQVTAVPGPDENQVTLKACNVTAAAINPPSQAFLLGSFPATIPGAATNTSALSPGSISAGKCIVQSFGVPGAAPGDAVIASPIAPVASAYKGKLVVTSLTTSAEATNEGSYKVCNIGTSVSAPLQSFRVTALHPPPPPCDPTVDFSCPGVCDPLLDPTCENPCADPFATGCSRRSPRCGGRKPTIVGTKRADVLRGTKKRDVILAKGGRDTLLGGGGNDLLCGGGGKDKLLGGPGDDRLIGGGGDDKLVGGPGSDQCDGGPGKDHASGCKSLVKIPS